MNELEDGSACGALRRGKGGVRLHAFLPPSRRRTSLSPENMLWEVQWISLTYGTDGATEGGPLSISVF